LFIHGTFYTQSNALVQNPLSPSSSRGLFLLHCLKSLSVLLKGDDVYYNQAKKHRPISHQVFMDGSSLLFTVDIDIVVIGNTNRGYTLSNDIRWEIPSKQGQSQSLMLLLLLLLIFLVDVVLKQDLNSAAHTDGWYRIVEVGLTWWFRIVEGSCSHRERFFHNSWTLVLQINGLQRKKMKTHLTFVTLKKIFAHTSAQSDVSTSNHSWPSI
jgi:hypothetical protein